LDPLQYEGDSVIYIDTQPEPTTNVRACTSRKRARDQVQTLTFSQNDDMHIITSEHSPEIAVETTDYDKGSTDTPLHPSKTPTTKPLSQLGVLTMNVQCIFKSRYDLQQAIHQHKPDIMVLTETKLRNTKSKLWMDGLMKTYNPLPILREALWSVCAKRLLF
jgi:hypothetical protein